MANEKRRCKECEGKGEDCKCPEPKRKKGYYGLEKWDNDDENDHPDGPQDALDGGMGGGEGGGAMGEAVKMPRAPQDSDKSMEGMSREKKQKRLSDFRAAAGEAKKRQGDEDRKAELASERRTKGIRFYDAKGSGYIKGGKKHYD